MTTYTPFCGEHRIAKKWQRTTFEYEDDGVAVRVPNVYAWVCPQDGEASFTSETVDELIETVRELLETAKRARERRSVLTEYLISVGQPLPMGSPA
jgi:YgiT-type zinc finger domain-containing protein